MNKILTLKLNNNMIKIIGSYLLTSMNIKNQFLTELILNTNSIYYNLNVNKCFDNSYSFIYFNNLKNGKIKHVKGYLTNYWTIRKT